MTSPKHVVGLHRRSSTKKKSSSTALVAIVAVALAMSIATVITVTKATKDLSSTVTDSSRPDKFLDVAPTSRHRKRKRSSARTGAKPPPPPAEVVSAESPSTSSAAPRVNSEDLVSWILSGTDADANKGSYSALQRMKDSHHQAAIHFEPGKLSLSHAETLRHCYADPAVYDKHFHHLPGWKRRVSLSEEYRLAYLMLPKSGSSTARFMMEHDFHAKEKQVSLYPGDYLPTGAMDNYTTMTFVRDPLSRFFSQYDEAYARTGPWQKGYRPEDGYVHPFPHLHENFTSYHDYEDVFCPPETRENRKDCIFRPSKEDGNLARRLEKFVDEYDGRSPFDIHLHLQVPLLSETKLGHPLHVAEIYNTSAAEAGWKQIAKERGVVLQKDREKEGGVIEGRAFPRRFDSTLVKPETRRRICELTMIDYCCLNIPLPEPCRGGGEAFECRLDYDWKSKKGARIQPAVFPGAKRKE